jgi:hypothetical protein
LRRLIAARGWGVASPDPVLELVISGIELPPEVTVVPTMLVHDKRISDCPPHDLQSALQRLAMHLVGTHAMTGDKAPTTRSSALAATWVRYLSPCQGPERPHTAMMDPVAWSPPATPDQKESLPAVENISP